MRNSRYQVVVVGGSLYSLVLVGALINGGVRPGEILLVESSDSLGGQFRSDRIQDNLFFDKGTRILYETGDKRADRFILSLVDRCRSSVLSGNRRDIGGVFVDRRLETGSVFPSFRNLAVERQSQILGEVLVRAGFKTSEVAENARSLSEYLNSQFGPTAREFIHEAICRHVFNVGSTALSTQVLDLLPLNRLAGFSHELMMDLSKSEGLRSRLAFPDQLKLPHLRKQEYSGYYPTSLGIGRYVDAAETILREAGVQILVGHSVVKIRRPREDSSETELLIADSVGTSYVTGTANRLVWTSGARALAACMSIDMAKQPADVSRKVAISHLLVTNVDSMGSLYYAYNYDAGLRIFRVTNYAAYCRDSQFSGLFPMTVESFVDNSCESNLQETIERDLTTLLGHSSSDRCKVQSVGQSTGTFPQPRLDVEERWACVTQKIADQLQGVLCFPGLGSKSRKFLGRDIVNDLLAQCDQNTI